MALSTTADEALTDDGIDTEENIINNDNNIENIFFISFTLLL